MKITEEKISEEIISTNVNTYSYESPKMNKWKHIISSNLIWVILVVIVAIFSIMTPLFFTPYNLTNILLASTVYGILSVGMTLVMINGNIDLSVGAIMAMAATLAIGFQSVNLPVAIIAALLVGVVLGAINGLFVAYVNINAFIVTLAAMIGIRGLIYIYTGEQSIMGSIMEFSNLGNGYLLGIPYVTLIFLLLAITFQLVLSKTVHGRNAYSIGGNKTSAINAGINVKRHVFMNFIISGLIAAIAGIVFASRMNAVTPTIGQNYELMVLIALILGGVRFSGGYGNIFHAVGGVLVISVLENGFNILNIQSYYTTVIMGIILIIVITLNSKRSIIK